MAKKVSISDVAKSLGMSKTVVSLVINGKGDLHRINKDTQQRVLLKVTEMNYQPNVLARGFRTGKTNTIGLIVTEISNTFYSKVASYIEELAWQQNYSVVICSTNELVEKEKRQIKLLVDRKIDGIIISSSQKTSDSFDHLLEEGIPHVLIDRSFENSKSPSVSVDNFGGARMAARHLITQGITDIALVALKGEHVSTTRDRIAGFRSSLSDHNLSIPESRIIHAKPRYIHDTIKNSLQSYYYQNKMPRAIFAIDNNLTFICLEYLQKLSVKIPAETALIGFDDLQYFRYTDPSISAIEQPVEKIGEAAFNLLLEQIKDNSLMGKQNSVLLPVDINIRRSSKII